MQVCEARLFVDLVDGMEHLVRHCDELRSTRQPLFTAPHVHVLLHLAEEQRVLADARHGSNEEREHLVRRCMGNAYTGVRGGLWGCAA